jgi:type VI secretion system protein ImpK
MRAPATAPARRGALALALQETFTAIARLRTNRASAADAESFRAHVKQLLATADGDAKRAGYAPEDVNLAIFATVAFLDESVLNSSQPMFADWPRRPLQEELFGGHMAGELFYQYLDQLLRRPDSEDVADVLEVFQLCLLLGFRGRYSHTDPSALHRLTTETQAKIARIRGPLGRLSPHWKPLDDEAIPRSRDPWLRPLAAAAGVALVLALGLYVGYRASLSGGDGRVIAAAEATS